MHTDCRYRFWFLVLLVGWIWVSGCHPPTTVPTTSDRTRPAQGATPLSEGIRFLLEQQDEDRLWRSSHYGNLKGGAAITCFVLRTFASLESTEWQISKPRLQQAADRLVPLVDEHGYITNPDGPDYTNYASSMFLVATKKLQLVVPERTRDRLIAYLVEAQLDEGEGMNADDPDYGGWDLSGWMKGPRPSTGSNISVTCSVLEALSEFPQAGGVQDALKKCRSWISRCQNRDGDGGFFFHPRRDHDGNKAGWSDGDRRLQPRSYGTATADGLRALKFLGFSDDSPHRISARNWLLRQGDLHIVPGFEHEHQTTSSAEGAWSKGLRFYYYFSLGQALHQFPPEFADQFAEKMIDILQAEQSDQGGWQNINARMREDDPIIATGFAVMALAHSTKWLQGSPGR